eukprot:scaffold131685_cov48-Phaeocystis_antarctica.AAC.1
MYSLCGGPMSPERAAASAASCRRSGVLSPSTRREIPRPGYLCAAAGGGCYWRCFGGRSSGPGGSAMIPRGRGVLVID